MNYFMLAMFLVTSCSSWKQKDFEKSLEQPVKTEEPDVADKDKKLLEKFAVEDKVAPAKKEEQVVIEKKPIAQSTAAKAKAETAIAKAPKAAPLNFKKQTPPLESKKQILVPDVREPQYPKNYPEELKVVNEKAKKVWDQYTPHTKQGEKSFLDIHYLGMTVGKIMVVNKGKQMMNGKEVWHFHARFKSAPFYSNIYELDNNVDTYVSTDKFLSAKYTLIQRESKQSIDDLQLYDREALKTFWFYKQKRPDQKEKRKDVKKPIPYYSIDPFSVLFLFQGLPLKDGDKYEIPIVNKGKVLILTSIVEGRETLDTAFGKEKAIRVHATTQYSGDHLKSGDLYFWFSDDSERKLLSAKAKIKIGSVTADIVKD